VLSPLAALITVASIAGAQDWPGKPTMAEDLRAALAQVDAGSPAQLLKLADSGRPDAQYYAGVMFIFGRGSVARDPRRGCAYAQKAATARADAMHVLGECYRRGLNGPADMEQAKAAFARADQMGFPKSKCALGEMLLADQTQAQRGLQLCREAGEAGDVDAQMKVAQLYMDGGPIPADHAEARNWYQKAADRQNPEAARKLGEMYRNGDGGKRDVKKAMELWKIAEREGDPLTPILVADQLFSDLTGGKSPGPGKFAFRGGIPVADIEVVEDWYRQAQQRDPRPEVKKRAQTALSVLASFKTAAKQTP
jgi:TPR repeat protein